MNNKYFGVIYLKDNKLGMTYHLFQKDTQEECLLLLKELAQTSEYAPRMIATTVIKRDMDNFKENMIFGNPKSLNVVK